MYSNFKGKDDLFLAVLDAEARLPTLPKATLAGRHHLGGADGRHAPADGEAWGLDPIDF